MSKAVVVICAATGFVIGVHGHAHLCYARAAQSSNVFEKGRGHEINFAGPPQAILPKVPPGSGFWSFAICVPNVLSRSGQPSMLDFRWLKDHGWKSVVNLRFTSNANWPGFKDLNFNYLALPIKDNSVPTDKQVQKFLEFVTSPYNQPVHIFCHAGIGRTGVMIVLYRYMVQGWPMEIAILESRFRGNGMEEFQIKWLRKWAHKHKAGSFSKQPEKR